MCGTCAYNVGASVGVDVAKVWCIDVACRHFGDMVTKGAVWR